MNKKFKFLWFLALLVSLNLYSQNIKENSVLEEPPFFRECKRSYKKTNECFQKQFKKHFKRRFNAELPYKLDLKSGKKTIHIDFRINVDGIVDSIKVNAPHKKIELEVIRVLKKFPKLYPGIQNGVTVPVKYYTTVSLFVSESKSEKKARRKKERSERKNKN